MVRSKAILDASLERELPSVMLTLARCSSSAWDDDQQCPPCRETVGVTSKYPRPVNSDLRESDAVADFVVRDAEREGEGHETYQREGAGERRADRFDSKRDVLDTLVLNLYSNVRC